MRWACVLACATALGCNVNDYCLNCAVDDAGADDASDASDGGDGDAFDAEPCVQTGPEVCDDKDNDCDGSIDEAPLPEIGDACANQVGECAGAVKECVSGAVSCSRTPHPEQCDLKDNDCNGLTDEGDPGGGAKCGTDVGECIAGTLRCNTTTGVVQCIGAIGGITAPFGTTETCDGKDNDCDNSFDEAIGGLGSCGGGPGIDPDAGECQQGTLMCSGGGTTCVGDRGPQFEACDTLDNDCDTRIDEDTNKLTDPQNCGSCGFVCNLANAFEGCAGGVCTIASCQTNFHDDNNTSSDGCEYACTAQSSVEVCNGIDDDCKTATTEAGITPPANFCLTQGACSGATASCQGADGFRCSYGADVTQDTNGNVVQEVRCDGIDNDCDGQIDEGQPNLGNACADTGIGQCQGTGTFQCDAADLDGPAICVITQPGQVSSTETCDGKDNNCDGIVDNSTGADRVIDAMTHVQVGALDYFIDTFEAARPDASAAASGTSTARACSNPGVKPWNNATFATAVAACAAANKVLCTPAQWQTACEGPANRTYPYGNSFNGGACNTESFDGVPGGGDNDVLVATGAAAGCISNPGVRDLSGNLKEWTDDITGVTGNGTSIAVLRGGSFETPAVGATCDFRLTRAAVDVIEATNGFRCCRATAP